MSEPKLPDDIEALLAVERDAPAPSPEAMHRVLERLERTIDYVGGDGGGSDGAAGSDAAGAGSGGAGSAGAGSGGAGSAGAGAAGTAGVGASLFSAARIGTFVAGAVFGGVVTTLVPTADVEPPPAVETPPPPLPVLTTTVTVERRPPAPAPAPPEKQPRPKRRRADTTARERALLERARTALGRSQPEEALAALREHRTRFKRGRLREERAALVVAALSQLGRHDEAAAAARRFLRRYPNSLFGPMVEAAMAPPSSR